MPRRVVWLALGLVTLVAVVAAAASGRATALITGKEIAKHTISSQHLVDHTIQTHDLSTSLVASLKGARGAVGPQGVKGDVGATGAQGPKGITGATGAQGPKGNTGAQGPKGDAGVPGAVGPQGVPGLSGYEQIQAASSYDGSDMKTATAMCTTGKKVLSGGVIINSPPGQHQLGVYIDDSFPVATNGSSVGDAGWTAGASESAELGAVWGIEVYAICATVAP